MIKVSISALDIEIKGHAGYDNTGFDIVCASVSTAVTMCINQIELFDRLNMIEYQLRDGYLKLHVVVSDEVLEKILKNLIYTLSDLENQYPHYLKVREF